MQYLNPYELLELAPNADESSIKKAKRRKLAELELNDGHLTLGKEKIYKSDFLKLCEELEDPRRAHYHAEMLGMRSLRSFLAEGNLDFFKDKTPHSLWGNTRFIEFISPYFAGRYGEELAKALKIKAWRKLESLCKGILLIKPQDQERTFQAGLRQWQAEHEKWREHLEQINEAEKDYPRNTLDHIAQEIEQNGWIRALNLLPQAAQSARDEAAQTLRSLSVAIFNNLDDLPRAKAFALLAKSLNAQGLAKQRVEEAYEQLQEIEQKRKESAQLQESLKDVLALILMAQKLDGEIEQGNKKSSGALYIELSKIEQKVKILQALSIQGQEHQNIMDKASLVLRHLAVTLFNDLNEGQQAKKLLALARSIKPSGHLLLQMLQDELEMNRHIEQESVDLQEALNDLIRAVENPGLGRVVNFLNVRKMLREVFSDVHCQKLNKMFDTAQKSSILNLLIRLAQRMDESTALTILQIGRKIAGISCGVELQKLFDIHSRLEEQQKRKKEEEQRQAEAEKRYREEQRKKEEDTRKRQAEQEELQRQEEQRRAEQAKRALAEQEQRRAEEKRRADEEKRKRELAQTHNSQPQATNDYMSPAQEAALKNVFRILFWLIVVLIILSSLSK